MKNQKIQRQRTSADVAVKRIAESPWNVHAGHDEEIDGLAESIKQQGVVQRLTVRPIYKGEDRVTDTYELVDGHRRFRAAKKLKLETVPCDIVELTDEEAQAATLAANVQRLGNDPLLEASLIERMRDAGKTYAQIAAAMGKDERYVARRARLTCLTGKWRELFRKAGAGADMADMMETVARHDPEMQVAVFAKYVDDDDDGQEIDEDDVEHWFASEMRTLDPDYVPFDVAGCAECESNTATHGCLFPEYEDRCGRCQNAGCFARRWNLAVDAEIEALRKRGVKILAAKDEWSIPNYWDATPHKELKNTIPYVYDQNGIKHLVWSRPNEKLSAAAAMTEEEKAEERRVKAAHNAWAKNRRSALEKIREEAGSGDHAAFARSLVRSEGFLAAMEEKYERLLGRWIPDDEAKLVLDVVGAAALGLTAEEAEAMASEDPTVVAARKQNETSGK